MADTPDDTRGDEYTQRLVALQSSWWKRFFRVQAPYRWKLHRLHLGFTLDSGAASDATS